MSGGFSYESSACLLMALERGVGGAGVNAADLQAGGAGTVDTSGFNIPILTDAWGRPIYFSRVPAGCPTLNPSTPTSVATMLPTGAICYAQPGNNDPGDPQGLLQTPAWATAYGGFLWSDTQRLIAPLGCSYKLVPMVASGGAGRAPQPGLDPATLAPFPGGSPMYGKQ